MPQYYASLAIAALALIATPIQAAPPPDLSGYPELRADALLPQLLEGIRHSVPDPYSIRDLAVCPPANVKFRNGRPVGWYIEMTMNAKGEQGGYTGIRVYGAVFQSGHLSGKVILESLSENDAFNRLFNRMMEKKARDCPLISNAQVQAYFNGDAPREAR